MKDATSAVVVHSPSQRNASEEQAPVQELREQELQTALSPTPRNENLKGSPPQIPPIFALPSLEISFQSLAESQVYSKVEPIHIEDWIFGQYNRLLPVKATCRALYNLSAHSSYRKPLERVALEVAKDAARLSNYLMYVDEQQDLARDDTLSVAFPKASSHDGFKSVQRFANQFVGSFTREGQMLGLPASLGLVGKHPQNDKAIALTKAGSEFARMTNPLLDRPQLEKIEKFSEDELKFLLDYIATAVPIEAFAYGVILKNVLRGRVAPSDLDEALSELSNSNREANDPFISTQRSGVISRMSDLDLISRHRNANRVSYVVTQRGKGFFESLLLQ